MAHIRWFFSRFGLLLMLLAMWGLSRFAAPYHPGAWLDSLPMQYQVPLKLLLILGFVVVPFAIFVAVMPGRGKPGPTARR